MFTGKCQGGQSGAEEETGRCGCEGFKKKDLREGKKKGKEKKRKEKKKEAE